MLPKLGFTSGQLIPLEPTALKALTDYSGQLHLDHPCYGARRMAQQLARESFEFGRLHVITLMRCIGIEALYRKPRTSIPARQAAIHPYLLPV